MWWERWSSLELQLFGLLSHIQLLSTATFLQHSCLPGYLDPQGLSVIDPGFAEIVFSMSIHTFTLSISHLLVMTFSVGLLMSLPEADLS